MSQLWDRREHRVDYRAVVRLKSERHNQPVMARAGNLSQSGLLVDANQTYDIGTELVCELPLPDDDQIHLRGRVAWVADREPFVETEPPGGAMGIEFTDPKASGVSVVQRMVGPPRREVRKVDAWFEGVDQPVRVEALTTDDGLRLRTAIPFLRVDSAVSFVGPQGEQADCGLQAGLLRDVVLRISPDQGVPYLELRVDPDAAVRRQALLRDHKAVDKQVAKPKPPPPLPGRARRRDQLEAEAATMPAARAEDDASLQAEMEDLEIEVEEPQASHDGMDLALDAEPPQLHEPDTLAHELGQGTPDSMASYLHQETDESSSWLNSSEADSEFWGASAVPRRRGWIWAGALAMAAVAVASIVHTRAWERLVPIGDTVAAAGVGQQAEIQPQTAAIVDKDIAQTDRAIAAEPTLPKTEALAEKPATPAKPTLPKTEALVEKPAPPAEPVVKAAVSAPPPAKASHQPPAKTAVSALAKANHQPPVTPPASKPKRDAGAPQVVHNRDGSTGLTIPIRGSLKGLNRYPLANPDGFVVKLPHARPRIAFGDYRLRDGGFRLVWVRAHENGVHLRFLFSKPTRQHDVKVVDGRVVVTLQPPPEQLSEEDPT